MRMNIDGVIGELTTLPGCTQVVVSHSVFVPTHKRGKGLGKTANSKRIEVAYELGYDHILCTVDASNEVEKKILSDNGWLYYNMFKSRKTGHWVCLYGRSL